MGNSLKKALIISLICLAPNVSADFTVIVNRDNQAPLSKLDVAKIFMGKIKKLPNGAAVLPINQKDDSLAKIEFDEWFIGKTSSQMKSYWAKVIFTGKAVPIKTVETSEEVVDLVSKNPGAIGYVDENYADERVKILYRF